MLVKQIRFTNIEIASELLSFKGFVVEKNNTILDTTYTILKGPIPSNGSLDGLILNSPVDYLIHKGVWLKVAGEEKQYEFLREEAVVCHKEFRDVRYFDLKVSDEIIRLKSGLS
jgi:hypothetical protein